MTSLILEGDAAIIHHLQNPETSYLDYRATGENTGVWSAHSLTHQKQQKSSFIDLFKPRDSSTMTVLLSGKTIRVLTNFYKGDDSIALAGLQLKVAKLCKEFFPETLDFDLLEDSAVGEEIVIYSQEEILEQVLTLHRSLNELGRQIQRTEGPLDLETIKTFSKLSKKTTDILSTLPKCEMAELDQAHLQTINSHLSGLPELVRQIKTLIEVKTQEHRGRSSTLVTPERRAPDEVIEAELEPRIIPAQEDGAAAARADQRLPSIDPMALEAQTAVDYDRIIGSLQDVQSSLIQADHAMRSYEPAFTPILYCDLFDDQEDLLQERRSLDSLRNLLFSNTEKLRPFQRIIENAQARLEHLESSVEMNDDLVAEIDQTKWDLEKAKGAYMLMQHAMKMDAQNHTYHKIQNRNKERIELLQNATLALNANIRRPMFSMVDGNLTISERPLFGHNCDSIMIEGREMYVEKSSEQAIKQLLFLAEIIDIRGFETQDGTLLARPARASANRLKPALGNVKEEFKQALFRSLK